MDTQAQTIPMDVYRAYLEQRAYEHQPSVPYEQFVQDLLKWYGQYQHFEVSLGYAAKQLGIGKAQMIDLLDMLHWQVAVY